MSRCLPRAITVPPPRGRRSRSKWGNVLEYRIFLLGEVRFPKVVQVRERSGRRATGFRSPVSAAPVPV